MTKLSNHGRVEQKAGEVQIVFEPLIPFSSIQDMLNECATGKCSCGCDPQMLAKVDKFIAEKGQNGTIVHLKGEQVRAQDVEKNFAHCNVDIPLDDPK